MKNINGHEMVLRIDALLKAQGRTRKELAGVINRTPQVFVDWKNKKDGTIMPKSDELYMMAKYLGVPMEYLLLGDDVLPDDIAGAAAMLATLSMEQRAPVIAMLKSQVEYWKNINKE